MTAEEIFNLFFSGGSPGSSVQRSGREQQEEHGGYRCAASNNTENEDEDREMDTDGKHTGEWLGGGRARALWYRCK